MLDIGLLAKNLCHALVGQLLQEHNGENLRILATYIWIIFFLPEFFSYHMP